MTVAFFGHKEYRESDIEKEVILNFLEAIDDGNITFLLGGYGNLLSYTETNI